MFNAFRCTRPRFARQARSLHIGTHTVQHPTPESISHLMPATSTVYFSVSTSVPAESLFPLLSTLPPLHVGSFHISDIPSISLAVIEPDGGENISTFYDGSTGRGPIQLGKWGKLASQREAKSEGRELGDILAAGGWEDVWRGEEGVADLGLSSATKAVLCFTDGTPQPLLAALGKHNVVALGLVSAPTPFLTGRPHTLFHNGTTHSTGSVGIALSAAPQTDITYGLEPLDKEHTVETARGNLLLTLEDGTNPTQTLIAALQARDAGRPKGQGLSKDEDFFLSIKDGSRPPRIVRILSGDPSRGTLSIDVHATLSPGDTVQFMHRCTSLPPLLPLSSCLRFGTLPRAEGYTEVQHGETRIMPGFLAASEDGFIFGDGQPPAVCTVAGASVTARWWT